MAILLGLLMQRRPRNQTAILEAFPGSSRRQKLQELIDTAKEFTSFYVNFTNKVAESQQEDMEFAAAEDDEEDRDKTDLRGSVGQVLRDTKGEKVAKDVIAFLDGLRSSASD